MRILLADDQPSVRSALRLLLEQEQELTVVAEVSNSDELLAQIEAGCHDLVLLDWELPGKKSEELVAAVKAICPGLFIIALSSRPEARRAALKGGADDFVSKGSSSQEVLAAPSRHQQLREKGI